MVLKNTYACTPFLQSSSYEFNTLSEGFHQELCFILLTNDVKVI